MSTATRPKTSGSIETPHAPLAADGKASLEATNETPVQTWEYVLFWVMLICMGIMWGMMMLDLFGSGFWVIVDMPR